MVTVDVFTLGYNEEKILPHFIHHYKTFCRNITFFNNMSTDSSVKICIDSGVTVIDTGLDEFNDIANVQIKHASYVNSDADFVIVVDTDELVYHPDIVNLLEGYKEDGVTLPKIKGYTMVTDSGYPEVGKLTQIVTKGIPSINYAKR
jgi:glycosyltransferase involved in cell wall biosynthesis